MAFQQPTGISLGVPTYYPIQFNFPFSFGAVPSPQVPFTRVGGLQVINVTNNAVLGGQTFTIDVSGGFNSNSNGYLTSFYDRSANYMGQNSKNCIVTSTTTNVLDITDVFGNTWQLTFSPLATVQPYLVQTGGVPVADGTINLVFYRFLNV
mgnify:CR=1 FL=1